MDITTQSLSDIEAVLSSYQDNLPVKRRLFRFSIDVNTQFYRIGDDLNGFGTKERASLYDLEIVTLMLALGCADFEQNGRLFSSDTGERISFHPHQITGYLAPSTLFALINVISSAPDGIKHLCYVKAAISQIVDVLSPVLLTERLNRYKEDVAAAIRGLFNGVFLGRHLPESREVFGAIRGISAFCAVVDSVQCKETHAVMDKFIADVIQEMVNEKLLTYDIKKSLYSKCSPYSNEAA